MVGGGTTAQPHERAAVAFVSPQAPNLDNTTPPLPTVLTVAELQYVDT